MKYSFNASYKGELAVNLSQRKNEHVLCKFRKVVALHQNITTDLLSIKTKTNQECKY